MTQFDGRAVIELSWVSVVASIVIGFGVSTQCCFAALVGWFDFHDLWSNFLQLLLRLPEPEESGAVNGPWFKVEQEITAEVFGALFEVQVGEVLSLCLDSFNFASEGATKKEHLKNSW